MAMASLFSVNAGPARCGGRGCDRIVSRWLNRKMPAAGAIPAVAHDDAAIVVKAALDEDRQDNSTEKSERVTPVSS